MSNQEDKTRPAVVIPFPGVNGHKAAVLPVMTIQERILWATSHRLPENMLIVARTEFEAMTQQILRSSLELQQFKSFCKAAFNTDMPPVVVERYNRMCEQFNALEAFFLVTKRFCDAVTPGAPTPDGIAHISNAFEECERMLGERSTQSSK